MARSSAAEVATRVDTIMSMILRGSARKDLCEFALKEWQVSDATTDRYIASATEQIKSITQPRKEYEYALVRQRLEELYDKTLKAENYNTALAVLKQVAEMTGINEPTKIDIEVNDLTDAQSRLARLVAGHATARNSDGVADKSD